MSCCVFDGEGKQSGKLHQARGKGGQVQAKSGESKKMACKKKVCLIVIDGWGISDEKEGNAVLNAQTPVMDKLREGVTAYTTLAAHGLAVGLPEGLMGNSEVGHLNIGAGRPVYQDIVRINMSVKDKSIQDNPAFVKACERATSGTGRLHLAGLVSDGGVHAHIDHFFALLEGAKKHHVPKTYIHYFADGRDTRPTSGAGYCKQLVEFCKKLGYGEIATLVGRYYAMDRDKRWERIQIAYEGLVQGKGELCTMDTLVKVMEAHYEGKDGIEKMTDEFMKPLIANIDGRIQNGDTLVFLNFRADRMREISEALGIKAPFETSVVPSNLEIYCMAEYKSEFPFKLLFGPEEVKNSLAEWISSKNLTQYHCAETEKYAHVTFFFNGGIEAIFPGEERKMVPSPKVPTYDKQPEMNAVGVADEMVKEVVAGKFPFLMCNFAPPDMVGHTGVYEAAVKGVEATDTAIGRIWDACNKHGYVMMVTSDHGNAEKMISEQGGPHTAHTCNRVPYCMTGGLKFKANITEEAALCDVSPTVLDVMGLDLPTDMTGKSLLAA